MMAIGRQNHTIVVYKQVPIKLSKNTRSNVSKMMLMSVLIWARLPLKVCISQTLIGVYRFIFLDLIITNEHIYDCIIFIAIVSEYCSSSAISFAPESTPDYKQNCREVAYGVCEGAIGDQVDDDCSMSTSDLLELQSKCKQQVNEMTGGDDDDFTPIETSRYAAPILCVWRH